jgi:hypothetical protein
MATPGKSDPSDQVPDTPSQFVDLPSGKPLTESQVSDLLRARSAPVVLLAGAVKSGKTTLLACLHDSFQWGGFAGYLAAGSQTLIGFEERCFDSRAASRADEPSTGRTIFKEGQLFYHIRLRDEGLKYPIRDLLFVDMSGEYYERAIDSAAEMRDLVVIRRADHFVHLIDGARLVSKELRAHTRSNAMMLMRRCFEETMLGSDARVDVLLTKWDIVLARCGEEEAGKLLDFHRRTFADQFGHRVARLRVVPIAARPHYKSPLQAAYGITDLLRCWVEEPPRQLEVRMRLLPVPKLSRPFDAFALRVAPELFEGASDV